ncbi:sigma factor [Bacillus ndiopicus]|uniref:sigma factor n=1 Tax=Bacillus ndiopicus TaxID=1347368 RepID=UPI0005A9CF6D|nr:sigma factor [Bacillus ndiopicus]
MQIVYERHYEAIYQYILFLTTNPAIVDDFVQETFIWIQQKTTTSTGCEMNAIFCFLWFSGCPNTH